MDDVGDNPLQEAIHGAVCLRKVGSDVSRRESGGWDLRDNHLAKGGGNIGATNRQSLRTCVNMGEGGDTRVGFLFKVNRYVLYCCHYIFPWVPSAYIS